MLYLKKFFACDSIEYEYFLNRFIWPIDGTQKDNSPTRLKWILVHSARAVEYNDCISAEG